MIRVEIGSVSRQTNSRMRDYVAAAARIYGDRVANADDASPKPAVEPGICPAPGGHLSLKHLPSLSRKTIVANINITVGAYD